MPDFANVPTIEEQHEGVNFTLRALALAGEDSGDTRDVADAVKNAGWIKNGSLVLDVTVVPTGTTNTLDVFVQTKLPNGTWTDLVHFAQVTTSEVVQFAEIGALQAEGPGVLTAATFVKDAMLPVEDATAAVDTVRRMLIGDSLSVKWVFVAGDSSGDYTFSVIGRGQD